MYSCSNLVLNFTFFNEMQPAWVCGWGGGEKGVGLSYQGNEQEGERERNVKA